MWAISNQFNGDCVANMNSFLGAMQFSIETQMGIGYGHKYVTNECGGGMNINGNVVHCY